MQRELFALLLLISLSSSVSLEVSSSVDYSGQSESIIHAYFNSSTPYSISFNGQLSNIKVRDRSGLELNYTSNYANGHTTLTTTVPSDYLQIDFDSDSFTSKNGSSWLYYMELGSSLDISSLSATLLLPDNSTVYSSNGAISQKGNSLYVLWDATNVSSNKRVSMKSSYLASPNLGLNLDLSLLAILLILVVIVFVYLQLSKKSVVVAQPTVRDNTIEQNSVFKTLDEIDRQIVLYIHSKGGQTTQADLNLNTHIPKATLSRRVASLESRGIIQKSQKGIRNIISLTSLISNEQKPSI
ncbi:MAG: helix-turn-helix transcriptional regulator [Candidatus Bilamarchaeum sp.]